MSVLWNTKKNMINGKEEQLMGYLETIEHMVSIVMVSYCGV